jgi:hypothetical protein
MLKVNSVVIFCAFLPFAMPVGVRAATIANNSFETPSEGAGGYEGDPSEPGVGWTFSGGAGIASQGSPWFSTGAPDGTQAAFLQSYQGTVGSFSQTISDLTIGDSYQISFWDAIRTSPYTPDEFAVSLGGTVLGTYTPGSTTFAMNTTDSVVATATSEVLTFQSISPLDGNDKDSIVDLVNITGAPEPGTVGLLIPALGYIGFSIRRRRRVSASR